MGKMNQQGFQTESSVLYWVPLLAVNSIGLVNSIDRSANPVKPTFVEPFRIRHIQNISHKIY